MLYPLFNDTMDDVASGSGEWDLNCDLGEGEPPERTEALFAAIGSANVACGGHAGNAESMLHCARLAARHGVRLGVHPGASEHFGRGEATLSPGALAELVAIQFAHFRQCVAVAHQPIHHVKLHGSLYHLSDASPEHAAAYLLAVRKIDPRLRVYARAGGRVSQMGAQLGLEVWPEIFLDRGYTANGELIRRGLPGAELSVDAAWERWRELARSGRWQANDGAWLEAAGRTLCVHGDNPGAVELTQRLGRDLVRANGQAMNR